MRYTDKSFTIIMMLCIFLSACAEDAATTDAVTSSGGVESLGTGSQSSGLSDLQDLPNATDAVSESTSSIILSKLKTLDNQFQVAATEGLPLATAATDEFELNTFERFIDEDNITDYFTGGSTSGSYAGCEAVNYTRGALGQIGEGDALACISKGIYNEEDLESGEFSIKQFDLDGEGLIKTKFRKILADDGNIKAIEFFVCVGTTEDDFVQSEYFSQDYSNGGVVMVIKGSTAPDNPEVDRVVYKAVVSADEIDDTGALVGEKTLDYYYQNLFTSGSNNHVHAVITQDPTTITYNGATCEKTTEDATTCDNHGGGQQLYFQAELLNHNEEGGQNLNLFALGNGAAYMNLAQDDSGVEGLQIWNGDTGNVENSETSDFATYITENYTDLLDIDAEFDADSVLFNTEETWDCSGSAEEASIEDSEISGCFAEKAINQNIHLECGDGGGTGENLSTAVIEI